MNKKIILTTKGSNISTQILGIIISIILFVFLLLTMVPGGVFELKSDRSDMGDLISVVFPILLFITSMATLYTVLQSSKTYLNIYEKTVMGKGIANDKSIVSFQLDYGEIKNITKGRIHNAFIQFNGIFIHTSTGTYKIIAGNKRADEIFQYFNNIN